MPRTLMLALTGLTALTGTAEPRTGGHAAPVVREVADRSLRDVAVAVYSPTKSVIYFNPDLMARFSPELQRFFMAHEYAHIALRHTRAAALGTGPERATRSLQAKELEADCLAAIRLGREGRPAALAAVRFFARLGPTQFDNEHPAGSTRAAKILSCMDDQAETSAPSMVSRSR